MDENIPCTSHFGVRSAVGQKLVVELVLALGILEIDACKAATTKQLGAVSVSIEWVQVTRSIVICIPIKDKFLVTALPDLSLLVIDSHVVFLIGIEV